MPLPARDLAHEREIRIHLQRVAVGSDAQKRRRFPADDVRGAGRHAHRMCLRLLIDDHIVVRGEDDLDPVGFRQGRAFERRQPGVLRTEIAPLAADPARARQDRFEIVAMRLGFVCPHGRIIPPQEPTSPCRIVRGRLRRHSDLGRSE